MIGEKLKLARVAAKLNQQQLADEIGLTQASISQFEKGERKPSYDTLKLMSKVLGVKIDQYLEPQMLIQESEGLTPYQIEQVCWFIKFLKFTNCRK